MIAMCIMIRLMCVEMRAAVRSKVTLGARLMLKQGDKQEEPPISKLRDRGDTLAPSSLSKA